MLRVSAVCVSRRRMFDAPGLSSAPRPQALLGVGPLGVAPLSGPRMGAGTSLWLESQSPLVLSAHRDGSRPGAHPKGVSARNGVSHSDDTRYRRNASLWVRATGVVLAPENHGRKQTTPMTAAIPASPIGLRRPARQGGDGGAFPGRLSPNTPAPRPRTGSTDDGNDNPGRALVTGVRHPAQTRGVFEARATGGHFGPYARLRRTGSMSHVDPGGPTASPRHSTVMGSRPAHQILRGPCDRHICSGNGGQGPPRDLAPDRRLTATQVVRDGWAPPPGTLRLHTVAFLRTSDFHRPIDR